MQREKNRSQPLMVTRHYRAEPGRPTTAENSEGQDSRRLNNTRPRASWCVFFLAVAWSAAFLPKTGAQVSVCFSPGGHCETVVLTELNTAKQSVLVQAYNFTSPRIINGLTTLARGGVTVRVLLDRSWHHTADNAEASLTTAGIPVLIDAMHPVAHAKVIIIDDREVLAGSYNWTNNAATRNSEDLLTLTDPRIVTAFVQNWQLHAAHSTPPK